MQACLNGARPPGFHAALPLTPEALAADGAACVAHGAEELHVHPRGPDGRESLDAAAIGAAVAAIRARLPDTPLGVSTGAWIERDAAGTLAAIGGWHERPDYASVNLSEPAAPDVMALMMRVGIGIEAGIATLADADRLIATGLAPRCLRLLIEIRGDDPATVAGEADAVRERLAPLGRPILLHGFEGGAWPLIARARALGLSTRVGLEDVAVLPDGAAARDNAALVRAALHYDPGVLRGRAG